MIERECGSHRDKTQKRLFYLVFCCCWRIFNLHSHKINTTWGMCWILKWCWPLFSNFSLNSIFIISIFSSFKEVMYLSPWGSSFKFSHWLIIRVWRRGMDPCSTFHSSNSSCWVNTRCSNLGNPFPEQTILFPAKARAPRLTSLKTSPKLAWGPPPNNNDLE